MSFRLKSRLASLALGALALVACGRGGDGGPVDESAARQALAKALDGWVAGARAADLRKQSPEIIAVDQDWTDGCRLMDYEVVGTGMFDGKNLRAPVTLTLQQPPRGPARKISANFIVGLQPVITVVRVME